MITTKTPNQNGVDAQCQDHWHHEGDAEDQQAKDVEHRAEHEIEEDKKEKKTAVSDFVCKRPFVERSNIHATWEDQGEVVESGRPVLHGPGPAFTPPDHATTRAPSPRRAIVGVVMCSFRPPGTTGTDPLWASSSTSDNAANRPV